MVAACCSVDRPLGILQKVGDKRRTKHKTQKCSTSQGRGEKYCLAYSAKQDEDTGQPLRRQLQMADGMSVLKGVILDIRRGKEILHDSKWVIR